MFFFFFPDHAMLADRRWGLLADVLGTAYRISPDITASSLRTLVFFALNQERILKEKLSIKAIARELDITYTTVTRQIDILSSGIGGRGGQALLEKVNDGRLKRVELTVEGMNLMRAMWNVLELVETRTQTAIESKA